MSTRLRLIVLVLAVAFSMIGESARAQLLTYTYQGRLEQAGVPANGTFDMRFRVFNLLLGGTQLGATWVASAVPVTDGLFTVPIDGFSDVAQLRPEMYLEIEVRPNPASPWTLLTPRQRLTPSPLAMRSLNDRWSPLSSTSIATDPGVRTVLVNATTPFIADAVMTVRRETSSSDRFGGLIVQTSTATGVPYFGLAAGGPLDTYAEVRMNGNTGIFSLGLQGPSGSIEPVQIALDGSVGLGTFADSAHRLSVSGNARVSGFSFASDFVYIAPLTRVLGIPPQALQPRDFGGTASGSVGTSEGLAYFDLAVGAATFVAGVQLPDGASIVRLEATILDRHPVSNVTVALNRRGWASNITTTVASVSSSGEPFFPQNYSAVATVGVTLVDNASFAYSISVSSSDWQGTGMGVMGIRIVYTVPGPR